MRRPDRALRRRAVLAECGVDDLSAVDRFADRLADGSVRQHRVMLVEDQGVIVAALERMGLDRRFRFDELHGIVADLVQEIALAAHHRRPGGPLGGDTRQS